MKPHQAAQRARQQQQMNSRGSIRTKKYQLPTQTYVRLGLRNILRELWWTLLIPVALMALAFVFPQAAGWIIGITLVLTVLYVLFWVIQFVGVTQLPQHKTLFERMSYELNNRSILMKINAQQGMPLQWDQIKKVEKLKGAYVLYLSKGQFVHLPFQIFNSENDLRLMDALLRRKNFLKAAA